jgi:multidrug resistance efflux pump
MPLALPLTEGLGLGWYDRGGWVTVFYQRMGDMLRPFEVEAMAVTASDQVAVRQRFKQSQAQGKKPG